MFKATVITGILIASAPLDDGERPSLGNGRKALRDRRFKEAAYVCATARVAAKAPRRALEAELFCADVARTRRRWARAARAYRTVSHWAVGDFALRRRVLRARRTCLRRARRRREASRVRRMLQADAKLEKVLARAGHDGRSGAGGPSPEALEAMRAVYRRDGDDQHAALVDAASALVDALAGRSPTAPERWRDRHPAVRAVVLRALVEAALAADDPERAAPHALQLDALTFGDLPLEARRYRRSPVAARACRAYDERRGPGACARLQLRQHDYPVLPSFLPKRRRRAGDVEVVHRDALPVLEQCVLRVARSDPERFRGVYVRLSWTVEPSGRATGAEVRPSRLTAVLRSCVDGPLAWFRYPRGRRDEFKVVEMSYHLE